MAIEKVIGKEVTVYFDGTRCIHSRVCVLTHPDVFVPNAKGDWIFPDEAPAWEVLHIGASCPSGAIRVVQNDTDFDTNQPPQVNLLHLRENGPYAFEADLSVNGDKDSVKATLCRCGESKSKPYCDCSHVAIKFEATGEPTKVDFQNLAERNGEVSVNPLPNGPLRVEGNLEIVSGTGQTVNKTTETFLCRCGHSSNKPYCDGTHAKIGFKAD